MNCTGFAFIFVQLTCTDPAQTTTVVCQPERPWAAQKQKATADAIRKLPPGSPERAAVVDLANVRTADRRIARACKQQPNAK
jgi:hypothetical protein